MNKLRLVFTKSKLTIFILIILIITTTFWLYRDYSQFNFTIKFSETGPIRTRIPVYFKGYRIGEVRKVSLTDDYKYSLVKIVLYPQNPKLSKDITAKAKHHDVIKDYIELANIDEPSTELLKKGDIIDGEKGFDLQDFLADIQNADVIVPMLQNFSDTLTSLKGTSNKIGIFFTDSRSILQENRQNLNQTTKNLTVSTTSMKKFTTRLNKSINDDKVNTTTANVNKSSANILEASENIKRISQNVNCATRNLDQTMAKIDCTLADTKVITSNVKTITCGVKETLCKKLGGFRIIFGKPLNNNSCCKRCN